MEPWPSGSRRREEVRWLARAHPAEVLRTSAKAGDNVEEAFRALAKRVARQQLLPP